MHGRRSCQLAILTLASIVAAYHAKPSAAEPEDTRGTRARPPDWSRETQDVFFEDARDQLVGTRPEYGRTTNLSQARAATLRQSAAQMDAIGAEWSELASAETIEAEIKRVAQAVAGEVATPSGFKGGGYKQCRRHFSFLAVLFAFAGEHDGAVRWSDAAPALRDQFARAGYNCKVGTDQTYRESSERSQELTELIRGSRPRLAPADRAANWAEVADRPPLMQRLEIAHQERLSPWLASEREFRRHRDEVRHEAQIVALLAEVIGREGFEYWDDEQYAHYSDDLRDAATDMAAAADLENYEQAKQAISRATRACTNCHEGYRG